MPDRTDKIETDLILEIVSDQFSCPVKILTGRERSSTAVEARHVAMSVMRAVFRTTFVGIGVVFNRDHSTVVHAIQRVDRSKKLQTKALEVVKEYRSRIKNHSK